MPDQYPKPPETVTPTDPSKTFPANQGGGSVPPDLENRITVLEAAKTANDTKDAAQDTSINKAEKLEAWGGW